MKLSRKEVHKRIKKLICFICREKWDKEHTCRSGKTYVMIDKDDYDESSSHKSKQDEAEHSKKDEEVEISLNSILRVQKPTSMRVMT